MRCENESIIATLLRTARILSHGLFLLRWHDHYKFDDPKYVQSENEPMLLLWSLPRLFHRLPRGGVVTSRTYRRQSASYPISGIKIKWSTSRKVLLYSNQDSYFCEKSCAAQSSDVEYYGSGRCWWHNCQRACSVSLAVFVTNNDC